MTTASGNNAVIEIVTKGPKGDSGDAGIGFPAGGVTGQVLAKASNDDYDGEWITVSDTGTVTSVDLDAPTGFAVAGGPITTAGTITLSYASGYQGYTSTEASKLAGIATGAEVNVNADWNATSGDTQILNKPTLGGAAALDVGTTSSTVATGDRGLPTGGTTGQVLQKTSGTDYDVDWETLTTADIYVIACSDETTALTTGTGKVTFRMPSAGTLTAVKATVTTAPVGSALIVDINEAGTTLLSTKLSIDDGEKTSATAATPPVISDSALADDAEITIDIDQVGSGTAGAGLKVTLYVTRG
jgi:hypothetical protein